MFDTSTLRDRRQQCAGVVAADLQTGVDLILAAVGRVDLAGRVALAVPDRERAGGGLTN